ncbi:hypothetical protein [Flavobacterium sp.]|uniref:hypothetical protein n=1 Tax=Flavobacterium sp. TaxID=239 RepID=UPI004047303F
MFIPKELKKAISHLPSSEKDKLIFKLLKKDLMLANRLLFELVNTNSIEKERDKIKERIFSEVKRMTDRFYSVGYLHVDVRYLSGEISEYISITKDKFGDPFLNLIMINEVLKLNKANILNSTKGKTWKFCVSVIARAFKILLLIKKLDEDYFIEFKEGLINFGKLIMENKYLMDAAIKNGFEINWLLIPEIPDNLVEIHKNIREQGFLK